MSRRLRLVVAVAVGFVLLAGPAAWAEYRGSDLLGNVGPQSQVAGGLVDRYPLSAYALDYHVDVGITNPDGVPPMIAQWAAAQLWSATSFLVKTVIDLFTWAFSLDLLGGGDGALAPVSQAISSLYQNVVGPSWMVAGILLAGIWGIWKALVQRRYTETAGALAVSVLFVVIALFFVYQPQRTVGEASRATNQLSLAFLSGANRGSLDDPGQAKRDVADHLFRTLVFQPWVVLDFGGLSHCVDTRHPDGDGFPKPVGPHDPAANVCRDHVKVGADGFGGYAPRFLRQAAGSKQRTAEYDALRQGKAPSNPQFRGYKVDKSDSAAVDVQQAGGAFQRLTFSVVVFLGALGAVALLGFLSLAVILAQVIALVLLGFAPVALIVGIFPGAGHQFFRGWLAKLAIAVFIKALYSLVIAVVVAVSAALTAATESLGFLFAFGLQTLFFWALFLYRRQITTRLVGGGAGAGGSRGAQVAGMTMVQRGAHVAARPFGALVGAPRRDVGDNGARQESALAGGESDTPGGVVRSGTTAPDPVRDGHDAGTAVPVVLARGNGDGHAAPVAGPHPGGDGHPVLATGPRANGNGHAAAVPAAPQGNGNGHAAAVPAAPQGNGNGHAAAVSVGPHAGGNGHAAGVRAAPRAGGNGHSPIPGGSGNPGAGAHPTPHAGAHEPGAGRPGLHLGGGARPPADGRSAPLPAVNPYLGGQPGTGASASGGGAPAGPPARASEATPRASHEDVMRRARELRERRRESGQGDETRGG